MQTATSYSSQTSSITSTIQGTTTGIATSRPTGTTTLALTTSTVTAALSVTSTSRTTFSPVYSVQRRAYQPPAGQSGPSTRTVRTADDTTTGRIVIYQPLSTFPCISQAYVASTTNMFTLDIAASTSPTSSVPVPSISSPSILDAIEYRPQDGYIFGVSRNSGAQSVYRIAPTGESMFITSLGNIGVIVAGAIDNRGNFWIAADWQPGFFFYAYNISLDDSGALFASYG